MVVGRNQQYDHLEREINRIIDNNHFCRFTSILSLIFPDKYDCPMTEQV